MVFPLLKQIVLFRYFCMWFQPGLLSPSSVSSFWGSHFCKSFASRCITVFSFVLSCSCRFVRQLIVCAQNLPKLHLHVVGQCSAICMHVLGKYDGKCRRRLACVSNVIVVQPFQVPCRAWLSELPAGEKRQDRNLQPTGILKFHPRLGTWLC